MAINFSITMIAGDLAIMIYQFKSGDVAHLSHQVLYNRFSRHFSHLITDFSLGFTIAGMFAGILPGYKKFVRNEVIGTEVTGGETSITEAEKRAVLRMKSMIPAMHAFDLPLNECRDTEHPTGAGISGSPKSAA